MALDPITAGIDLVTSVISRIWPDKTEQEKAQLAAALAADANVTALLTGQLEVNKEEAKSSNLFVAGWRPSVGWICALAFAWQFVILPIMLVVAVAIGHPLVLPVFDTASMSTVLMGMLGLGGFRTVEKMRGKA
jgi:hypothetical protein